VAAEGGGDPEAFIARLHAALLAHAGERPQPDDLTVLIVQRPAGG
jgi:serine phosphatase RsbU (regulator of sigma subunit)